MSQLRTEVCPLGRLQCRASCRSLSPPLPAARSPRPRRPLHGGHDGIHRFRRRDSQAGKIPLPWRSPSSWCSSRRREWFRTACLARHGRQDPDVERAHLVIWWLGGFRRLHAL